MAISIAKHYYSDLNSIVDPLRILQSIDYTQHHDPMELSITAIDENISQNLYGSTATDLEEYVEQSFSGPKDSNWSSDFTKLPLAIMPESTVPTTSERDAVVTAMRKRRMDWGDPLDVNGTSENGNFHGTIGGVIEGQENTNSGGGGGGMVGPSEAKISHLANVKERRKTGTSSNGRLGWTDDIEFDLNGELSNNAYLNNEALLSLSTELTNFKYEIPSPTSEPQKLANCPQQHQQQQQLQQQQQHQQPQQQQQHQQQDQLKILNVAENVDNSNSNSNGSVELNKFNMVEQQPQHFAACESPSSNDQRFSNATSEQSKFQYVLAASTSIATKSNEDTLTYLNQGQSYEIKLKKLGDLSTYRGKMLKSIIKICFHERRLQYMEREQMFQWQNSRPGERIVEIDVPLSYGLCQVAQSNSPNMLNTVEVLWDPMKEVGVYIQVNCISTEFTPKKHGGEKGVPFRIQVETYLDNASGNGGSSGGNGVSSGGGGVGASAASLLADNAQAGGGPLKLIHAAACQIKVFKLKGADRKHKQDREKIQKRTATEQEKYQPSYECTILTDIPIESISPQGGYSPEHVTTRSGNTSPFKGVVAAHSPVHTSKFESTMFMSKPAIAYPIGINSVSSSNSIVKYDQNSMSPQHNNHHQQQQQQQHQQQQQQHQQQQQRKQQADSDECISIVVKDSTPGELAKWMNFHRLGQHSPTFSNFSGADLLRMSKEDIIRICGKADGIRMYNSIHLKAITPRLTIYVSLDNSSYHAIYLHANNVEELAQKLCKLPGFSEHAKVGNPSKLSVYVNGPAGIHVLLTDEVLNNIKDDSLFVIDVMSGKVLMKAVYKNENN